MLENDNSLPSIGDKFPNIKVKTTHGELSLLDKYENKWFVLFSHPGDFTPVCTTEFHAFAKKHKEFQGLNCELIGLSMDQVFSHIQWSRWIEENLDTKINFPIIADEAGKIASHLGMLHPAKGSNTVRAVFIVDSQGFLRSILYYPQELGRNIEEIIRMVKALQVADEKKVAMPANWPNNELINDKGIIPPATDEETAKKREQEDDCYDWWFCYKDIK